MKTKSGHLLTAEDLAALAAEAEAGYEVKRLKKRALTREVLAPTKPIVTVKKSAVRRTKVRKRKLARGR